MPRLLRSIALAGALLALALAAVGLTGAVASGGSKSHGRGHHHGKGMPSITKEPFGSTGGMAVDRYTLDNGKGMVVKIITYGGTIQELWVPDQRGRSANVVLGFPTLDDYVTKNSPFPAGGPYFGVDHRPLREPDRQGHVHARRGHVPPADQQPAELAARRHRRVRQQGLDRDRHPAEPRQRRAEARTTRSPDGEEGYPGNAERRRDVHCSRTTTRSGSTTAPPTTARRRSLNLTNHSYWNLSGEGSGDIYDHVLWLNADRYTPVDSTLIPTGAIDPVAGTPFDFTKPTAIGDRIRDASNQQIAFGRGYDHNWVLNRPRLDRASFPPPRVFDPASGRVLKIDTTEPGIQFYSGNFLDGTLAGTSGKFYRQSDGFALETQHYPDSPNQPNFPSTVLRPGQTFASTTVFALSTAKHRH